MYIQLNWIYIYKRISDVLKSWCPEVLMSWCPEEEGRKAEAKEEGSAKRGRLSRSGSHATPTRTRYTRSLATCSRYACPLRAPATRARHLPGNGGNSVLGEDSVVNWKAPFEVEGSAFFWTGLKADISLFNKLISLALIGGNNVVNSYCKNSKRKR